MDHRGAAAAARSNRPAHQPDMTLAPESMAVGAGRPARAAARTHPEPAADSYRNPVSSRPAAADNYRILVGSRFLTAACVLALVAAAARKNAAASFPTQLAVAARPAGTVRLAAAGILCLVVVGSPTRNAVSAGRWAVVGIQGLIVEDTAHPFAAGIRQKVVAAEGCSSCVPTGRKANLLLQPVPIRL